jgi:hypothetical protein
MKAAGNGSTAMEASAGNTITKKHKKRKQKVENPPESSSSSSSGNGAAACFASKFGEHQSKRMWCICHCSLVVAQVPAQSS